MIGNSDCGTRRVSVLMQALACSALLAALPALAAPVVMVDAVPSAAQLVNFSIIEVPFPDLEKADARAVEQGISSVIAKMSEYAEQFDATHICLFSSAAAKTRSFRVEAAKSGIRLKSKDAELIVV